MSRSPTATSRCSCGGGGADDPDAAAAANVWTRLKTSAIRASAWPQRPAASCMPPPMRPSVAARLRRMRRSSGAAAVRARMQATPGLELMHASARRPRFATSSCRADLPTSFDRDTPALIVGRGARTGRPHRPQPQRGLAVRQRRGLVAQQRQNIRHPAMCPRQRGGADRRSESRAPIGGHRSVLESDGGPTRRRRRRRSDTRPPISSMARR